MTPQPLSEGCQVRCSVCSRAYTLSPRDDYYDATNTMDGKCEACILKAFGCSKIVELNPEVGDRLEAEFQRGCRQKN